MWTQFTQGELANDYSSGVYQIEVTDPDQLISVGNWLVIKPEDNECEIRKVIATTGGTNPIVDFDVDLKFAHYKQERIFVQTSPNWDILLFGAQTTNSGAANRIAVNCAITDCKYSNVAYGQGAIVSIPKGQYIIENFGFGPCIDLSGEGSNNIKIVGEGMGVSILISESGNIGSADMSIFRVNTNGIEIRDLTIDGNCGQVYNSGPACHCIFIIECSSFKINQVECVNAVVDGINISNTTDGQIYNCRFWKASSNGINVIGNSSKMLIEESYFSENILDLKFQDGLENGPSHIIVTQNTFASTGTYSLVVNCTSTSEYIISDNIFEGGAVSVSSCYNMTFTNNIILSSVQDVVPFVAEKLVRQLQFENNVVVNNACCTEYAILITSNDETAQIPVGVTILGNTFENGGCHIRNTKDVIITGNKITQRSSDAYNGVLYELTASPDPHTDYGNLTITNNQIVNAAFGIKIASSSEDWKFRIACIDNNIIEHNELRAGIYCTAAAPGAGPFWDQLLIGNSNTISTDTGVQVYVENNYLTGSNPVQEEWVSIGNPNKVIAAPQGAFAVDRTIEADNNYVKNMIKDPSSSIPTADQAKYGWELVSEVGKQILLRDYFENNTAGAIALNSGSHIIATNVFGSNTWPSTGWQITASTSTLPSEAQALGTPINVATFTASSGSVQQSNGEIKAVFRYDPNATGANLGAGLAFRFDSGSSSYWKFYIFKTSTLNVFEVRLEKSTGGSPLISKQVWMGPSNRFVVKVIMDGNYISTFFNDLFLGTIQDPFNASAYKHGMYVQGSTNNVFFCQNFKLLIPQF